jgi:hypothetical protein
LTTSGNRPGRIPTGLGPHIRQTRAGEAAKFLVFFQLFHRTWRFSELTFGRVAALSKRRRVLLDQRIRPPSREDQAVFAGFSGVLRLLFRFDCF